MILISYVIETSPFTLRIIQASTTVGAIRGLNQTSIGKIVTYSFINHTG
jgi:NADH:ubiquinone oxidoreductase subunit 2 (subunit N)